MPIINETAVKCPENNFHSCELGITTHVGPRARSAAEACDNANLAATCAAHSPRRPPNARATSGRARLIQIRSQSRAPHLLQEVPPDRVSYSSLSQNSPPPPNAAASKRRRNPPTPQQWLLSPPPRSPPAPAFLRPRFVSRPAFVPRAPLLPVPFDTALTSLQARRAPTMSVRSALARAAALPATFAAVAPALASEGKLRISRFPRLLASC